MNILFVSSEIYPFSKTGGLADFSGSLPFDLQKKGCHVLAVTPYYKETRKKKFPKTETEKRIEVKIGEYFVQATIVKSTETPFPFCFINQPSYFNRDSLYGDMRGDYPDNAERFIFFAQAVLETAIALDFHPDVIHCHDWQTGLIPVYLQTTYRNHPVFQKAATLFTIHNLAYQGNFNSRFYPMANLDHRLFHLEGLEFYNQFSFLKAGLVYSDYLTTVSQSYRNEILEDEFGCGMEGILRKNSRRLKGIVNGIDDNAWNPETDSQIASFFSSKSLRGKRACRRDLLDFFGVTISEKSPVIGLVTRLNLQKGIDIVVSALDLLMERNLAVIILGSGDRKFEESIGKLAVKYQGKIGVHIGFSENLAHKIYAGSDLFLMPSRFEPCGISHRIAMRYGTVPIVHAVGGLIDTVSQFDSRKDSGNGFRFSGFSSEEMIMTIELAMLEFNRKKTWKKLVKRIMEDDYSWSPPAKEYIEVYEKARKIRLTAMKS